MREADFKARGFRRFTNDILKKNFEEQRESYSSAILAFKKDQHEKQLLIKQKFKEIETLKV